MPEPRMNKRKSTSSATSNETLAAYKFLFINKTQFQILTHLSKFRGRVGEGVSDPG